METKVSIMGRGNLTQGPELVASRGYCVAVGDDDALHGLGGVSDTLVKNNYHLMTGSVINVNEGVS
jgi:hypothetical protein